MRSGMRCGVAMANRGWGDEGIGYPTEESNAYYTYHTDVTAPIVLTGVTSVSNEYRYAEQGNCSEHIWTRTCLRCR